MFKHVIVELDARDLQKSDVPVLHLVFCVTHTHICKVCALFLQHKNKSINILLYAAMNKVAVV